MKITIAGGDRRMKTVAELFIKNGFDCNTEEIKTKSRLLSEINASDAVRGVTLVVIVVLALSVLAVVVLSAILAGRITRRKRKNAFSRRYDTEKRKKRD